MINNQQQRDDENSEKRPKMRKTCSRARKYNTDYSISINGKKLLKTAKN